MPSEPPFRSTPPVRCCCCGQLTDRPVTVIIAVRGRERQLPACQEHASSVAFGPELIAEIEAALREEAGR